MLDSLVRVSRRVGWSTDRFATDPAPAQYTERTPPLRSRRALQAVKRQSNERGAPGTETSCGILGLATSPPRRAITHEGRPKPNSSHLPAGPLTAAKPVVALRPEKVHPAADTQRLAGRRASPLNARRGTVAAGLNSPGRTAAGPPVYLYAVSRTVELSLQSSFQLSLTVLVRYRTRASI